MLGDHPTTKLHLQPLGFYYRYFRFTLFLLMCMCLSMCECARGCLRRPEEGLKLNLQVAVRNSGPQKKQQAFWTAEPSLQPGAGEKKKKKKGFYIFVVVADLFRYRILVLSPGQPQTHSNLLPQIPKCWDYRQMLPCPAFSVFHSFSLSLFS